MCYNLTISNIKQQKKGERAIKRTDIYSVTLTATLASLGAVLVIIGGFFEVMDLSAAAIASLVALVAKEEMNLKRATYVYIISSFATLIFMPLRSATLYYVLFLGYYPVLKAVIEKRFYKKKILPLIIKLAVFNAALSVVAFLTVKFIGIEQGFTTTMGVILIISANVFLFAYDKFLLVAVIIYRHRLKDKLIKKH